MIFLWYFYVNYICNLDTRICIFGGNIDEENFEFMLTTYIS